MTFVLDPNAVATGHNPDKFTQEMLTELAIFRFGRWVSDQCGDWPKQTYRTKLTKSQLAEKRGLNPSPGSAATAPDATPEPSSADDAREHAGAPVETPDELLRALNELQRHLGISFLIRCLAELSTPIHVEWTGQAFRRPNQKEVKPCANQNDSANVPSGQASAQSTEQPKSSLASNAAESSPTPDSGGNAADIIRWVIESLLSISENMDADQVGRIDIAMEQLSYALRMMKHIPNSVGNPYNGPFSTTHQNLAWQKAQDSGGKCPKCKGAGWVLVGDELRAQLAATLEDMKQMRIERDDAERAYKSADRNWAKMVLERDAEKQAHEHTKNCCDVFQLSLQAERAAHEQTKAKLEIAVDALKECRIMVQHEILVREMTSRALDAWPDLLTGVHSGGGIVPALERIAKP